MRPRVTAGLVCLATMVAGIVALSVPGAQAQNPSFSRQTTTVCALGKQPNLAAAIRAYKARCHTTKHGAPSPFVEYGPANRCNVVASRMYRRTYYANAVSYQECNRDIRQQGLFNYAEEFWLKDRTWHKMGESAVKKGEPGEHINAIAAAKCNGLDERLWSNNTRGFFEDNVGEWFGKSTALDERIRCQ